MIGRWSGFPRRNSLGYFDRGKPIVLHYGNDFVVDHAGTGLGVTGVHIELDRLGQSGVGHEVETFAREVHLIHSHDRRGLNIHGDFGASDLHQMRQRSPVDQRAALLIGKGGAGVLNVGEVGKEHPAAANQRAFVNGCDVDGRPRLRELGR